MQVPYVDLGAQYQEHRDEILAKIDAVLKSGEYIMGKEVEIFEQRFAKLCGTKHAIAVADGTASLSMCMRVLGIGPGDEVITCPNSFFSSASSIVHIGAKPVFCDVKADQTMDPEQLKNAITPQTKAIMPVHLTGKMVDMDAIKKIAEQHKLFVIEDAAQAVGASYKGKKAGSIGDFGSFSLHPLKNLNGAGDGGIITTNNDEHATKLKRMRQHGMIDRDNIPDWGYNSRLDTVQAAILNCKLNYLEEVTRKRRENAELYRTGLKGLEKFLSCPVDDKDCFDVYHLFVIQAKDRDGLKAHLGDNQIQTSIHYPVPIHLFECATKSLGHKPGDFPEVERQSRMILSLPIHQNLSKAQVQFVCEKIREYYSK